MVNLVFTSKSRDRQVENGTDLSCYILASVAHQSEIPITLFLTLTRQKHNFVAPVKFSLFWAFFFLNNVLHFENTTSYDLSFFSRSFTIPWRCVTRNTLSQKSREAKKGQQWE